MKSANKIFIIRGMEKPVFSLKMAVSGGKYTSERRTIKTPKPGSLPQNVFITPMAKKARPKSQLIKFKT
jgi:hypothetical protein